MKSQNLIRLWQEDCCKSETILGYMARLSQNVKVLAEEGGSNSPVILKDLLGRMARCWSLLTFEPRQGLTSKARSWDAVQSSIKLGTKHKLS